MFKPGDWVLILSEENSYGVNISYDWDEFPIKVAEWRYKNPYFLTFKAQILVGAENLPRWPQYTYLIALPKTLRNLGGEILDQKRLIEYKVPDFLHHYENSRFFPFKSYAVRPLCQKC